MIFVNKYSVIDHVIRMDEQILFSKVLWAKKTAAFRELSTDDQVISQIQKSKVEFYLPR